MKWEEFNGQELSTGDIILLEGKDLAFIDSSKTSLEPDRITSIPEAWSMSDLRVNDRKYDRYGLPHITESGLIYGDQKYGGDIIGKICFVLKLQYPDK